MRLFSLIVFVIVLFLLGLLFVRGRKTEKKNLSVYLVIPLIVSGLLFVVLGKIAIFLALLMISLLLMASRLR